MITLIDISSQKAKLKTIYQLHKVDSNQRRSPNRCIQCRILYLFLSMKSNTQIGGQPLYNKKGYLLLGVL